MILKFTAVAVLLALSCHVEARRRRPSHMTLDQCHRVVGYLASSLKILAPLRSCKLPVTPTRRVYRDCTELKNNGAKNSGIYIIRPGGYKIRAYCDMTTDGGGWTVIQRRVSNALKFFRGWRAYKHGFGDLGNNFWLGNDLIHQLTSLGRTTLRVDMWAKYPQGPHRFAKYRNFKVGPESSAYKLTVSGYSGNAGDSLRAHNGAKFSTKDRDNDTWNRNCAVQFKGAWWYKKCHHSNLNGRYLNGRHSSYADGINWFHFKGHRFSLQRDVMMIRRH